MKNGGAVKITYLLVFVIVLSLIGAGATVLLDTEDGSTAQIRTPEDCLSFEGDMTSDGYWTTCGQYDWSVSKTVAPTELFFKGVVTRTFTTTLDWTRTDTGTTDDFTGVTGGFQIANGCDQEKSGVSVSMIVYSTDGSTWTEIPSISEVTGPDAIGASSSEAYAYAIEFEMPVGATGYKVSATVSASGVDPVTMEQEFDMPTSSDGGPCMRDETATMVDEIKNPVGFTANPSEPLTWYLSDSGSTSYTVDVTNTAGFADELFTLYNNVTLTEDDSKVVREDSATVMLDTRCCPSITLEVIAPDCVEVGDSITIMYNVTNTGDTCGHEDYALDKVQVWDDLGGPNWYMESTELLAVNETVTFEHTFTVEGDMLVKEHTVTALGFIACCNAEVMQVHSFKLVDPSISLLVEAPECVVLEDSEVAVTWTATTTNDGNYPLYDLEMQDTLEGTTYTRAELAVGESWTENFTSMVSSLGTVTNTVTVTAFTECGMNIYASGSASVMVYEMDVTIEKSGPDCVVLDDTEVTVEYTVYIKNNGNGMLSNVVVIDDMVGALPAPAEMAPGAEWLYTYSVNVSECGEVTNTVTMTADGECGMTFEGCDSHTVMVVCPGYEVAKTGPDCVVMEGSSVNITWTLYVNNTGDVALDVHIVDGAYVNDITVAPGASWSDTLTTCETECGDVTNTATFDLSSECGWSDTATASHTVTIECPAYEVAKTGPECVVLDDSSVSITWTLYFNNTGDSELSVHVEDGAYSNDFTVAPGASWSDTLTTCETECGDVTNTATFTVTGECGYSDTATASHTVKVVCPGYEVAKTGPDCVVMEGSSVNITWTIYVNNTGDVALDVHIVDGAYVNDITVAPGASWSDTLTTMHTSCCDVTNTATFDLSSECGWSDTATASHTVKVVCPGYEVAKTGPECVVSDGSSFSITWTLYFNNTGDTELSVHVEDGAYEMNFTVAPGASWSDTLTTTHCGCCDVTNTATFTISDDCGWSDTATASHTVDVVCPNATIVKIGPPCVVMENGTATVEYTIYVNNTGDTTLYDLVVTDPMYSGPALERASLGAGETWMFNYTLVLDTHGNVTNTATLDARTECDCSLTRSDSHTVYVADPEIQITKTAPPEVEIGSEIVWSFEVCNTGKDKLSNLVITDDFLGENKTIASLEVGECESWTWTSIAEEEGLITNEVEVIAEFICGQVGAIANVSSFANASTVVIECEIPCLEIEKIAEDCYGNPITEVYPGDTIYYHIIVRNICKGCMANVDVIDPFTGDQWYIACLCPCCEEHLYTQYTVPADWNWCEDGDMITNYVFATGWCCGKMHYDDAMVDTMVNVDDIIVLEKTGPATAMPGETITYTFTVCNMGKYNITGFEVYDALLNPYGDNLIWKTCDVLESCECMTKTFTYTVPADWNCCDDPDTLINKASVQGYSCHLQDWICDVDMHEVDILTPCIIDVQCCIGTNEDRSTGFSPGETVNMHITLENLGCNPQGCIEVTDNVGNYRFVECLGSCEMIEWDWKVAIPSDWAYCVDGAYLSYEVLAFGWCCDIPVIDIAQCNILVDDPCHVEIDMWCDTYWADPGDTVTFYYQVNNLGSEDVAFVDLNSMKFGDIADIGFLASCDSSEVFERQYTVPVDWCCFEDGMFVEDKASGTYCCNCGNTFDMEPDECMFYITCPCYIDLVVNAPAKICPGDTITYEVTVTNSGSTKLQQIKLESPQFGLIDTRCEMEPGESYTVTLYHNTNPCPTDMGDYDVIKNFMVSADCCTPDCTEVHVITDTWTQCTYVKPCCEISVWKVADSYEVEPGDTITWTIHVENTGCCDLTCVEVVDSLLNIDKKFDGVFMAPGEVWTFTGTYTVPLDWYHCDHLADPFIHNTVSVSAYCCCADVEVSDTDKDWVEVVDLRSMVVDKTLDDWYYPCPCVDMCHDCFLPGTVLFYNITVMNKGEMPIGCIEVWDPMLMSEPWFIDCIPSCDSVSMVFAYMVPWDWKYCYDGDVLTNTVTAMGWSCGEMVEAEDTLSLDICAGCSLEVFKEGPATAVPGETITYTIRVHNTGSLPLCCPLAFDTLFCIPGRFTVLNGIKDMTVDDIERERCFLKTLEMEMFELECLDPCEWYNFTYSYTVPEDWNFCCNGNYLYNGIYAVSQCVCCHIADDCDCAMTEIIDMEPMLKVKKECRVLDDICPPVRADAGEAEEVDPLIMEETRPMKPAHPGDTVMFTVWVYNPNQYAMGCVNVTDDLTGETVMVCCIPACSKVPVHFYYTIPENWSYCADGEYLYNHATVTAWYFEDELSAEAECCVRVLDMCDLRVTKTVDKDTAEPGDVLTFTVSVHNAGQKDMCAVYIHDYLYDMCRGTFELYSEDRYIECLRSCEWFNFTYEYVVPEDWTYCCFCGDNDCVRPFLYNTVDVNACCCGNCVFETDTTSTRIYDNTSILVYKTADKDYYEPGDKITWTITVMNCGEKAACLTVDDITTGDAWEIKCLPSCKEWKVTVVTIAPNTTCPCEDILVTNIVHVYGNADGVPVDITTDHTVTVLAPCRMEVSIWTDPTTQNPCEWVRVYVNVTNTGYKDLTNVKLNASVDATFQEWDIGGLRVGKTYTACFKWLVSDYGCFQGVIMEPIEAHAVACCPLDEGGCCDLYADAAMDFPVEALCDMVVTKNVYYDSALENPVNAPVHPGDTVWYQVIVYNMGEFDLYNLTVVDSMFGMLADNSTLKVGKNVSFVMCYTVPCDWNYCDNGASPYINNTVDVTACCCMVCDDQSRCCQLSASASESLYVIGPDIVIVKTGTLETEPGGDIHYTITVRNVGPRTLCCVHIVDKVWDKCSMMKWSILDEWVDCIPSCSEVTFEIDKTVYEGWTYCKNGETLYDQVFVEATPAFMGKCLKRQKACSDVFETHVDVDYQMIICKYDTSGHNWYLPGMTVDYKVVVKNVGKYPLTNVHIVDEMLGIDYEQDCLCSCKCIELRGSWTIPDDWNYCDDGYTVDNTAWADAWGCDGAEPVYLYVETTEVIKVADCCNLEVSITGPEGPICPGDTITYNVTVSNVGARTMCAIMLHVWFGYDPACGTIVFTEGDRCIVLEEYWIDIWCLHSCENVSFEFEVTIPEDWSYMYNGEYLSANACACGCCCMFGDITPACPWPLMPFPPCVCPWASSLDCDFDMMYTQIYVICCPETMVTV